jgi:hypothetical protein
VIRADRELLAELARVNTDVAPLVMRMMEGSATAEEQLGLAERLLALGESLRRRAGRSAVVVEGETVTAPARAAAPPPGS